MNQVFIKSNVILFMLLVVTVRCQRSRYPPSGQRPNNVQGVPKTRFLELFIVADHELFSHYFNYSEPRMVDFIYEHALQVNSIINKLNVHIILSGYDIHIKRDPIPRGNHFSDRFDKLRDLQSIYSSRFKYDVFYFITGYYYPSTATNSIVLGKAYVNQTCTKQPLMATMYPDAENTHRYTPEGFAVVAAHELGHLLGMKHDTTDCHCPTRSCVMYPSYYEGHPSWSSCSVDIATRFLSSPSMDTCFHHPTQRESIKSICGNGLIEQGEECDCAYLDDRCRRKCCDMDTCKLRGNSRCSSGECCYDCQFKSRDDVCRQRNSHCDEAENCDGRSEFCPKDQFLPAGSVCHGEGESGICYGAKCQTRNDQCKQIAGPNSRSCDDKYYQANTRGDDRGYCDSTPTEVGHPIYTNCSEENVLCGALKCLWNPDRPEKIKKSELDSLLEKNKASNVNARPVQLDVYDRSRCSTFTYVFAKDPRTGLVADGTKCAADRMCLNSVCGDIRCLDDCNDNGKCVSGVCQCHQGYSGPSCVADYCRNNCNGRGQCNAKGKCQCFLDYGGEDCSRTGAGHPVYEDYVENLEDSSFGNLFLVIMCLIITIVAGALLFVYYQKHRYTTCFLMRLRVESISDQCRSQLGKMMKR